MEAGSAQPIDTYKGGQNPDLLTPLEIASPVNFGVNGAGPWGFRFVKHKIMVYTKL